MAIPRLRSRSSTATFITCQTVSYREQIRYPTILPSRSAARQIPEGFDSSSTNIASDQGVGNARRSIAITCGRSA